MSLLNLLSPYFISDTVNKVEDFNLNGVYNGSQDLRFHIIDSTGRNKFKFNMFREFIKEFPRDDDGVNYSWGFKGYREDIDVDYLLNITKEDFYNCNIRNMTDNEISEFRKSQKWSWYSASQNPNISMEFIEDNLEYGWFWYAITRNPNLTMTFVLRNIEKFRQSDIYSLTENKNISLNDILENKYIFDYGGLEHNPNLTIDFILKNPDKNFFGDKIINEELSIHERINNNWNLLSFTYRCNLQDIISNPKLNWNRKYLSGNPNLTIDFIKNNLENNNNSKLKGKWDWMIITENKNIKLENIENNIDLPWHWPYFGSNENLTIEFYKKYKNIKDINFISFNDNKNVTMEVIEDNPNLPWNWFDVIGRNPNLTVHFYKKYKDDDFRLEKFPNSKGDFNLKYYVR